MSPIRAFLTKCSWCLHVIEMSRDDKKTESKRRSPVLISPPCGWPVGGHFIRQVILHDQDGYVMTTTSSIGKILTRWL